MRRPAFDVLRRGMDNTLANWQLSLIRLGEALLFIALALGTVFIALLPILVSFGFRLADLETPEGLENAMGSMLDKWVLLLWIILAVSILLLIIVAIHSFVEAGCARVMVDADRVAGPAVQQPRGRYRVFSMERWMAGAKDGGWTVFWIYNIAWGIGGLIMLLPLLPTAAGILMFRDSPGVLIGFGCFGMAITFFVMFLVAIVVAIWTNRAVADWAVQRGDARATLRASWRAIGIDLPRHVLVAVIIVIVAFAGSSFSSSFSFFASIGETFGQRGAFNFVTLPLRLFGTLLSTAFSAFISSWFLASYAALSVEEQT